MDIQGLIVVVVFAIGGIATLAIIGGVIAAFVTGEPWVVSDHEPTQKTTVPTASICPRCGSPITDETHTTRHYETPGVDKFRWSETYCGKAPDLKSRFPPR